MELEVGMYCRSELLGISKIEKVEGDFAYVELREFGRTSLFNLHKNRISKLNHNIIDLIEEEDLIKPLDNKEVFTVREHKCELGVWGYYYNEEFTSLKIFIESIGEHFEIVTHEQFESISYKLGKSGGKYD